MAPYVTADQIAAALGVVFTPEQEAQADAVAAAVTSYIDGYVGRTWQTVSPMAGELAPVLPTRSDAYPSAFGVVYLAHRPAVAVTALALRTYYPNDTADGLDAASYELIDPAHGTVTVAGCAWLGYPALVAAVDYTYADAVPPDITLAATMIASGVMQRTMAIQAGSAAIAANPSLAGIQSLSVGQNDISVTLSATATGGASMGSAAGSAWAAPGSAVAGILDQYKRVVIA